MENNRIEETNKEELQDNLLFTPSSRMFLLLRTNWKQALVFPWCTLNEVCWRYMEEVALPLRRCLFCLLKKVFFEAYRIFVCIIAFLFSHFFNSILVFSLLVIQGTLYKANCYRCVQAQCYGCGEGTLPQDFTI